MKYTIGEVAHLLNRKPPTVRGWDREGLLPPELQPQRDERGRRVWTDAQVTGLQQWIITAKRIPGIGLTHYNPTPEQVAKHLERQRQPRPNARKVRNIGSTRSDSSPEG